MQYNFMRTSRFITMSIHISDDITRFETSIFKVMRKIDKFNFDSQFLKLFFSRLLPKNNQISLFDTQIILSDAFSAWRISRFVSDPKNLINDSIFIGILSTLSDPKNTKKLNFMQITRNLNHIILK